MYEFEVMLSSEYESIEIGWWSCRRFWKVVPQPSCWCISMSNVVTAWCSHSGNLTSINQKVIVITFLFLFQFDKLILLPVRFACFSPTSVYSHPRFRQGRPDLDIYRDSRAGTEILEDICQCRWAMIVLKWFRAVSVPQRCSWTEPKGKPGNVVVLCWPCRIFDFLRFPLVVFHS